MTTSVGRKGKVTAKPRDSWVWRWPGREMPAKVSVTSIRSMARPLQGTRWRPVLNSCKRGRRPGGREAGPPRHIPAGAIAGRALLRGRGAAGWPRAGDTPGTGRDGTGVLHSQTHRHSQESWGRGTGGGGRKGHPARPAVGRVLGASTATAARGDPRGASPRAPQLGSPRPAPCRRKGFTSQHTLGRGAGLALSTWLCAIPSSLTMLLAMHDTAATAGPCAGASRGPPAPWALGHRTSRCLSFPTHDAASGPWDRGGGNPAHMWHCRQSHARVAPLRLLPPSPSSTARRLRHKAAGCAGTRPLPSARRHVRGWLWGGRSLSQPRRRHASRKTFPRHCRQQLPEHPGTGVSEGQGCWALAVGSGDAGDANI